MLPTFDAIGHAAFNETPEDRIVLGGAADFLLDWEILIFAATHEYISRNTDDPIDTPFLGTLEKAFRLDRSIIGSQRIGQDITIGVGEVTLTNIEGDYDFLAVDHSPLGQRIVIKMGDRRKAYSSWRVVLDGYLTDMSLNRNDITFRARDGGHLLDFPASPNVYLGTGGVEGTDDLQDKRKPRGFGHVLNVTPALVIPSTLCYQLNDGPIEAVNAVYVRGVLLSVPYDVAADYPDVATMEAALLNVGEYATCLAEGFIRIAVANDEELGEVTCDFEGDNSGTGFVETAADITRRILQAAALTDPDDLVVPTFAAVNVSQPAPIGYFIPAGSEITVAQAAGQVMASIGGWCGARRRGKFEVQRFEAPLGTPTERYDRKNVVDVSVTALPEELLPPPWRVLVGYSRNWTPGQTNLAGSVTDARRAFLAEELRFVAAEDNNVRLNFPPGRELIEAHTFFRDLVDAEAEAERILELYSSIRALYTFKLCEPLFVHDLGEVVHLQFDNRFDLDDGKLLRLVKITEDDREGVELTGFG